MELNKINKKTKTMLTVSINEVLLHQLKWWSKENDASISRIIEQLVQDFLKNKEIK